MSAPSWRVRQVCTTIQASTEYCTALPQLPDQPSRLRLSAVKTYLRGCFVVIPCALAVYVGLSCPTVVRPSTMSHVSPPHGELSPRARRQEDIVKLFAPTVCVCIGQRDPDWPTDSFSSAPSPRLSRQAKAASGSQTVAKIGQLGKVPLLSSFPRRKDAAQLTDGTAVQSHRINLTAEYTMGEAEGRTNDCSAE